VDEAKTALDFGDLPSLAKPVARIGAECRDLWRLKPT
jgi:hypothetical protein